MATDSVKGANSLQGVIPGPGITGKNKLDRTEKVEVERVSAKDTGVKSNTAGNYKLDISDAGRQRSADFKKAFDIAKDTPDVREDRVAALKAQISAGTYKVDSGKIADGMLREAIKEKLATME